MMTTATLLTDHPAWTVRSDGTTCRLVAVGADAWFVAWDGTAVAWDGTALVTSKLGGPIVNKNVAAIETGSVHLPRSAPRPLTTALAPLGTVHRLSSPTLWEAINSGLLRKIIRAPQARALYQRWSTVYGAKWDTPVGMLHTVPTPDKVLGRR